MKIFLDMDGVLTHCHMAALNWHGIYLDDYPKGKRVVDIVHPDGSVGRQEFWDTFPVYFWSELEKTMLCDPLIEFVEDRFGRENVFIATRPTRNPYSLAGKQLWVRDNLPEWMHERMIPTKFKHLLAPGLLVDDSWQNCTDFMAADGYTVHVKRPWNGNGWMSTEDVLCGIEQALRFCEG